MAAADLNDPGDPGNKQRTRESRRQLRTLLMAWDLIGVSDFPQAATEYDCMLGPLLDQLHDGASEDQLCDWLVNEVGDHFGMQADPVRERRLAAQISAWWRRRTTESAGRAESDRT